MSPLPALTAPVAERVSERGLALTGLFIVGRRSVDLEELLEMAGVQRAA